jgi:hypothetical protein
VINPRHPFPKHEKRRRKTLTLGKLAQLDSRRANILPNPSCHPRELALGASLACFPVRLQQPLFVRRRSPRGNGGPRADGFDAGFEFDGAVLRRHMYAT